MDFRAVSRPNRTFPGIILVFAFSLCVISAQGLSTAQMVPPSVARATEAKHAVSFGDLQNGRIAWLIKREDLPWKGSYSFLGSADSPKPTILLTVSDSDTGVVIADCSTSVHAKSTPAGWRGELEQDFHWHRVNWELNEAELQCNTTADHQPLSSLLNSDELDAYLVQIKAMDGPRCIKNLHADDESNVSSCPPNLQKHSYIAEHLNCGCPIIKRGLPFAENTAFSSIRRKPASSTVDPLSQPFSDDAETSDEVASPAFPMFHFTQSVDRSTEKTTTSEAETPSTDATKPTPASAETAPPEQSQQISGEIKQTPESLEEPKTTVESSEKTTIVSSEASQPTTPASADPCDEFECNNGTCTAENGEAKCKCPEGFAGEHCEQDLCANLGCQNGGTCQVRNGRAVCNCPRGIAGEKCHQMNHPICNPLCENGGVCQSSTIATEGNVCKCPHGYTGSNCNLRDLCAKNSTCSHFGPDARCFKDAGDMFRFSNALSDGIYSCQCPTQRGFVECSQLRPTLAKAAPTLLSSVPPRPVPTELLPEIEEERTPASNEHSTELIQFPMVTEPAHSTASLERTSAEIKPMFGLTGLPGSQPTILPRPTQAKTAPPSPPTSFTTMFTRLPDLHQLLQSTPPPPISPENESEEDGDNGFAPMTQEVPEPTEIPAEPPVPPRPGLTIHKLPTSDSTKPKPLQTTTTIPEAAEELETEAISTENSKILSTESTHEATHGPMGPEHSIVDETVGTESPPEFHTVDPSGRPPNPFGEEDKSEPKPAEAEEFEPESPPTTTTTTTTTVGSSEETRENGTDASTAKSTTFTWIIALTVIAVLILAATIGSLLMARYVRRSRRLHGKYNPAREENAVASNYAMPMTSVNKDERLI